MLRQTDRKHNVTFGGEDREWAMYKNYRTWWWNKDESCQDCHADSIVTVPNLVYVVKE